MSFDSTRPLTNGHVVGGEKVDMDGLNNALLHAVKNSENDTFHGDQLLGHKESSHSGLLSDLGKVLTWKNKSEVGTVALKLAKFDGLDVRAPNGDRTNLLRLVTNEFYFQIVAGSKLISSLPADSIARQNFVESEVTRRYNKMLHPPLTYLGDAFQYRTADGKFNVSSRP